jgi:hypothetical protein
MRGEFEPQAGAFSVEPVIDGKSAGVQGVSIGTGLATWGSGLWGTFLWGGSGRRQFHKMLPLRADGRTAVVKAVYTGKQKFRLFNYHLGIQPETQSRAFSE